MLTIRSTFIPSKPVLLPASVLSGSPVFFDIETTGFRASSSRLYLIGAAWNDQHTSQKLNVGSDPSGIQAEKPDDSDQERWQIIQWFAETSDREEELLLAFADFLKNHDTLIHFNGDRFDIPYLEEKYTQHHIISPFVDMNSVDLYHDFRPLKRFLGCSSMKQKSLEQFTGLHRDDHFDGGELIRVYRDYMTGRSADLLKPLLMHNREDVEGTLRLTGIYAYYSLFSMTVLPEHLTYEYLEDTPGVVRLLLTFPLPKTLPAPVSVHLPFGSFTAKEDTGKLLLPVIYDTLYYYFTNYREYYYLPAEDMAIHKSVAAYVDREHRQKATRQTCYTKAEGYFLPAPDNCSGETFRRSFDDEIHWLKREQTELQSPVSLAEYAAEMIPTFLHECIPVQSIEKDSLFSQLTRKHSSHTN